jgi:hypothetical protein
MQIESTHNGEFMGASATRTNDNVLLLYVIFHDGASVTFDRDGYIVRGTIPVEDDRMDAAWSLASRLPS